jgi:hypothetical protein
MLVRLSTLLANPASTDALLGTTSYTLRLLHTLLSRLLASRLTSVAKQGHVSQFGRKNAAISTENTPLAQAVAATKAITPIIEDYRIFVRLWGLVGLYVWARRTWIAPFPLRKGAGKKEMVLRVLAWAEISSLAGFQILENGAYLASKDVLISRAWSGEKGKARQAKWWMWSSRFWAAYVALELVRLFVLQYYHTEHLSHSTAEEQWTLDDDEKESKLLHAERKKENAMWWRDLVSNLGYMPMTLHWSVEEGRSVLSEWTVSVLGVVAGGTLLVDAWGRTA